ncbi:flagellar biosynthetic protein FliO [Azonexus sp. IMCC34839]|uniref:flagellar biosynthetic protein FliO n=1 Tax=Azonexus sp. IMCC34839 TaxID=3133695 RepID=UPI00399A62E7
MGYSSPLLTNTFLAAVSLTPLVGYAATEVDSPGIPLWSILQTVLALFLVIGLMITTAWLARKLAGERRFGNQAIKIVGGIALGPRERVMLLEIGEEWLVVGVIPGQIRTLHRLPKGNIPSSQLPMQANKSFADWLQGISRKHADE